MVMEQKDIHRSKKINLGAGHDVHVYNPCFSRGSNQEDHSWRLAGAKKVARPHFNKQAGCV
jgi:hypothetical protein